MHLTDCAVHCLVKRLVIAFAVITLAATASALIAQSQVPRPIGSDNHFVGRRVKNPNPFPQYPVAFRLQNVTAMEELQHWQIESFSGWGNYPSLAFGVDSKPSISYWSGDFGLTYAHHDGFKWQYESANPLDPGWIAENSLALGSTGQPHIAFIIDGLKYAFRDNAGWHIETVDNPGPSVTTRYASLALNRSDQPHIVYTSNGVLKYAYRDGSGWHNQMIDSSGTLPSLALSVSGQPHVSYIKDNGLKYAFRDQTGWHIQTLSGAGAFPNYPSLALDVNGFPHISYCVCDIYDPSQSDLKYAFYNGSTWQIETVDAGTARGFYTSLALDAAGRPHIAYSGVDIFWKLYYAYKDGFTWRIESIDALIQVDFSSITPHISIALDATGRPHIAYNDGYGNVRYATLKSDLSTWAPLAFASYRDSDWEIYTSQGNGSYATRRTTYAAIDTIPDYSRGAGRIAFVSYRDGNSEIYTMNADGTSPNRLTYSGASDLLPSWSPDGSRIAFYSNRDGNYEVYAMNANGSNLTRLTSNAAWDGHPAWSPDGTKILFVSDRSGQDALWMMNGNGSNQQKLSADFTLAAFPEWSPDGTRIAFNDDANNDGWFDLAIINADGTGLAHPLGYSPNLYDYSAPVWAPDGQQIAFARIQWILYQGNYYWVDAYIDGLDLNSNSTYGLINSGYDWWPDWQTIDATAPSSQAWSQPVWSSAITFAVQWSGSDTGGSGLDTYDVQYRDGSGGIWTDWLTHTNEIAASFTGDYGHIYYFRSRARDFASNLEAYPSGDGDSVTGVYRYVTSGYILGIRNQPIAIATIEASPTAMNAALSSAVGAFDLYFGASGTYSLTSSRNGFAALPPMKNVLVTDTSAALTLYLPPADDRIADSGFEAGNLTTWQPFGAVTPTITTTAHTGDFAAQLGGPISPGAPSSGPWISGIQQEVALSPTPTSDTLSILYQVVSAEPMSDMLQAVLIGPTQTLTLTLPLTASGWTHQWWEVPVRSVPNATLRVQLEQADKNRLVSVVLDEISLGSAMVGSYPAYLPLILRLSR